MTRPPSVPAVWRIFRREESGLPSGRAPWRFDPGKGLTDVQTRFTTPSANVI
jgi:hypothetical protein